MPRSRYEQSKKENSGKSHREDARKKSFRKRSADAPTFDACNPVELHALVCLCTTYGASPTFSYTRDGTSLVVAIYHEGERHVDYLSGKEEFGEYLRWVVTELLECEASDLEAYAFITS